MEKTKSINAKRNGITLIALVITIIVLIILAAVSVNLVLNTNLIERVASAKEPNEIESIREKLELVKGSMYIDNKGKASIDTYFESLNKEKIEPYIVTKTTKITQKLASVEVNNKYSFLIKFENSIEIEYEGKLEEIERKEQIIEIAVSGENNQSDFPIMLVAEVTSEGKKVTTGKWVLNKEKNIGIDENLYTESISSEENINLQIEETGEYYIHVLTTDIYGRTKETVEGPITVTENYHVHTGSSTLEGGCYTTPVYHSHISSCYIVCSGVLIHTGQSTNSSGGVQSHYECNKCGWPKFYGAPLNGGQAAGYACGEKTLNCTKNTSIIDSYDLGCGKTEETQEGYIVNY